MPTYTIRRRPFGLGRSYSIKNEHGEHAFRLVGKLRFARTFTIKDGHGIPLLAVREKLLSLKPTFMISRDGTQVAVVQRETTSGVVVEKFTIDLGAEGSMEASGTLWAEDGVRVMRGSSQLARVWRVQNTVASEIFTVETVDTIDQALALAISMAIAETDVSRGERSG